MFISFLLTNMKCHHFLASECIDQRMTLQIFEMFVYYAYYLNFLNWAVLLNIRVLLTL